MIVKTIDLYDFKKEFGDYSRGDHFSEEAQEFLFDYYDDFCDNVELDVIGICCAWTEYEDLDDYAKEYMCESDFDGLEEWEYTRAILKHVEENAPCYFNLSNGGILFMNY